MQNKSLREWHNFNAAHYLKVLKHRLNLMTMSKQTRVEESIKAINLIPSKLFIEPNVTSTGVKYLLSGSYDGLVLTEWKKEELKRYLSTILEVYGLGLEDMAVIEDSGYITRLKLIIC